MSKSKFEGKKFYRSVTFERQSIDEENRTVALSFSSETPVERWDGFEVLGHGEGEIDTSFIGGGSAPLLLNHDHGRQIGVVDSVEVADGVGRSVVRFGRSDLASEIFQDVVDGIRSNISVGYMINKVKEVSKKPRTYRAIDWRPLEISLVTVPADEQVGVGRSDEDKHSTEDKEMTVEVPSQETPQAPSVDVSAIKKQAAAEANKRIGEIYAIGHQWGFADQAKQYVEEGRNVEEFRAYVMDNIDRSPNVQSESAEIGMTEKEVKEYSFMRALRAVCYPNEQKFIKDAGLEIEASIAACERAGKTTEGIMVPYDVLSRDLVVGTDTAGGHLVGTDHLGGSFIEVLRNLMVTRALGARMLTGLQGNVDIPAQTGAGTAYWVTEGNAPTESQQTFGNVALAPKTVGAFTDYTRKLLLQSSPDVNMIVQQDLASVLAIAIDLAALYGSGAGGQPTGIANTNGINDPATFAAAVPTFAEVVGMETAVNVDNALLGSLAYLTDATTRGGLKTQAKDAGSGMFVWENDTVNGYRAMASSQVTAGDVFFANWADLIIAMWGGLDLTVDPSALATSGGKRVIALQDVDIGVRHAASFCLSNDTP